MKKSVAAQTVAALTLAAAMVPAFANGGSKPPSNDPNKDCFESAQYPHGTPACKPPTQPPAPPAQLTQQQLQQQAQLQQQQAEADARARAEAAARANAQLTDNSRTEQNLTDNSRTEQTNQQTTQQQATDNSQNNAAANGNKVTFTDNSRTTYKAAANRAAPDGPAVITTGCWDGYSVSAGVGTTDVNVGGSTGQKTWSEDSGKCADHEKDIKKIEVDAQRESSLRASGNPVDQALAHEQAKASSDAYRKGDEALTARVNAMTDNGTKPLTIGQNDGHKLMGYNINIRPPVVTTITPPAATAPAADCSAVLAQFVEYAKAMNARTVTRTSKPAGNPPPPPAKDCKLEVEQALKAAGAAAPVAKPN